MNNIVFWVVLALALVGFSLWAVHAAYGPIWLAIVCVSGIALAVITLEALAIAALWRARAKVRGARIKAASLRLRVPHMVAQANKGLQRVVQGLDSADSLWKMMLVFGGWRGFVVRLLWKRLTAAPKPSA
ncbi:MAG: hypothetical protein IPK79_11625 [Vampirovibrionales bacterium]|nr:hypothetical protein [Vampirovibrionales bacterium]